MTEPQQAFTEKSEYEVGHQRVDSTQSSGDVIITINDPNEESIVNEKEARRTYIQRITETDTKPLEQFPLGYPRIAAFKSSEPNFSLYRGFNYLHSRVLLEMQDELRVLEANLDRIDTEDHMNGDTRRLKSRGVDLRDAKRHGTPSRRAQLLSTIRDKLSLYDDILVKARQLNAFQRPSNRDYRSVRTWFVNEAPLADEKESAFIRQREDIISLRLGREWSGFDGFIENLLRKFDCKLMQKIFTTPELREKTSDKSIHYYSASRVSKLINLIITFMIFILLILPVVAMYKLTSLGDRNSIFDAIGILVVFTLLFSAAMSLLTKAQRHELFAASAAYCAVLVVFISNFGGPQIAMAKGSAS